MAARPKVARKGLECRGVEPPVLCALSALLCALCLAAEPGDAPKVQITLTPPSDAGGSERIEPIEGTVEGACARCKIVLFARGDVWYVQPWTNAPFTEIQANQTWHNSTHLGMQYAALLVRSSFSPAARSASLPVVGGDVLAVDVVGGKLANPQVAPRSDPAPASGVLDFAGYKWEIKSSHTPVGPGPNYFGEENAWVDKDGRLHLAVSKRNDRWLSAEVISKQSFGYGTYTFEVADISQLPPYVTLGLFTWDMQSPEVHNRELDIEAGRWNNPNDKNLQCVVQPYTVPENIVRYNAPAGPLVLSLIWDPGRFTCRSRQRIPTGGDATVFEHTFTKGVPAAGGQLRINLWIVDGSRPSNASETEVVITTFAIR
jgi:hypothetical protein